MLSRKRRKVICWKGLKFSKMFILQKAIVRSQSLGRSLKVSTSRVNGIFFRKQRLGVKEGYSTYLKDPSFFGLWNNEDPQKTDQN